MEGKGSFHAGLKKITRTERKCNSCGFSTYHLIILYKHKYKCKGNLLGSPLKCGYCKRKYCFPFLLKKHQKTCVKRSKRKKIFLSKFRKESKKEEVPVKTEKASTTIVCPMCLKFFSSRILYNEHEKNCNCDSGKKVQKPFSARKSFSKSSVKDTPKRKYLIESSDSDSFTSDNLLSEIIDRNRRSYKSITRGYMCIHCQKMYPAKVILLKHLDSNYRCALAHYEQSSYYDSAHKAKKTLRSVVAKKSFSHSSHKNHSHKYKSSQHFEGSARKSFSNSSHTSSSKSNSFERSSKNQCPVCYKEFRDSYEFYQHQKKTNHWGKATKSMSRNCKCPFCEKDFFSVKARNIHLRNHTERSNHSIESFLRITTCDVCSREFASETLTLQHMKLHHPRSSATVKNYKATSENDTVKSSSLPQIIKQQLRQHPLACPVCIQQFASISLRNKHFADGHLNSGIECKFCPIYCNNSDLLDNHMQKLHADKFKHDCSVCKQKFPTASHLLLHIKRTHVAQSGRKSLTNIASVQQIPKTVVPAKVINQATQEQGYFCDICNLYFQKLQFLRRHEQSKQHRDTLFKNIDAVHESLSNLPLSPPPALPKQIETPKVLTCSECFEEFTVLKDYVPHRLKHFSEKEKYMAINEENPYNCEICGDKFDTHSKVQLHLFWHLQIESSSKEKNSDILKKNPSASKSANQHVAKKSFGKQTQEVHQKVMIGGVPKQLFTCESCHISFINQDHYNMHVSKICKGKNNLPSKTVLLEVSKVGNALRNPSPNVTPNKLSDKVNITIEKCNWCHTIYNQSVRDAHKMICLKCRQPKSILSGSIDKLKMLITMQKCVAACLKCTCTFDSPQMFIKHMLSKHLLDAKKDVPHITTGTKVSVTKVSMNAASTGNLQNENTADTPKIPASEADSNADEKETITIGNDKNGSTGSSENETALEPPTSTDSAIHSIEAPETSIKKEIPVSETSIKEEIPVSETSIKEEIPVSQLSENNNASDIPVSETPLDSNNTEILIQEDAANRTPIVIDEENIMHCDKCNFIFFSLNALSDHEKVCQQSLYTNSKLENFTPEFKAVLEENFIIASCLTCDLAFNSSADVLQHIVSHQEAALAEEQNAAEVVGESSNSSESKMETDEPQTVSENAVVASNEALTLNGEKSLDTAPAVDGKETSTSSDAASNSSQTNDVGSVIDTLRKNFSKLLSILVADNDLMHQLGYGELRVDEVLVNVLQTMDQTPVLKRDDMSDLECLRKNIQILLDICLEDQVMALIGDGKASTDDIVIEALKIFGGESSMSVVAIE